MADLTCLFLTVNRVPWMAYHNKIMLEAIGDYPLITISAEPMNLPGIQLRQSAEQSHDKIYKLMLQGAKLAATDYIAIVEDDMLYSKDHFELRPPLDTFGYNCNRCSILPRLEMIDALEERFSKWKEIPHHLNGELGFEKVERNLGVKVRKSVVLYSKIPVVQIHHTYGTPGIGRAHLNQNDTADLEARKIRKRMGYIRAYEVPFWGKSSELIFNFK